MQFIRAHLCLFFLGVEVNPFLFFFLTNISLPNISPRVASVHIMWLVPSNSSLSDWLRQMPKVFSHHLAQGVPNFNNQGKLVRGQSFPKEIFHR